MVNSKSYLNSAKLIALLSAVGFTVEAYDFFAVGIISTQIWPHLFDGSSSSALALSVLAYSTILVGRPAGGVMFGHLSDKLGRKWSMFWTLTLSGFAMLMIAIMPPIGIIGLEAIAAFRFIQGFGLGGDGGSSWTLTYEYSRRFDKAPIFLAGLLSTASLGILLGVLGIFLSESLETRIFLTDYGWRILIGLGAVAFALTIFFRYKVMESPDFTKLTEARELTTSPIREAIHKARRKLVFLTLIATYYPTVLTFAVYPFAVEYYSKVVGEKVVTLTFMGFALLAILFTLAGGALTTLIGWRGVLFLSILGSVVTLPLLLIHSLTGFIVFPVASIGWGALGMMAEEFETPIRNTCVGTVFGMMSLIPGILLVVVLPSLLKFAGLVGSVFSVVLIAEVISGISCIMLVSDGRRKIFH